MMQEQESSNGEVDPFRATQIWRAVIRDFRREMPCKRRRVKMHFHDNCFTGCEAVQWLHHHLSNTNTFPTTVTRDKVVKLLQKFLCSDVIEDVRGKVAAEFKADSSCLYKFVTTPGPFNFVGDDADDNNGKENRTPCKVKPWRPATPGTALGRRKRRRRDGEVARMEDMECESELFPNDHTSAATGGSGEGSFSAAMVTSPAARDEGEGLSHITAPSPAKKHRSGRHHRASEQPPAERHRHGNTAASNSVGTASRLFAEEEEKERERPDPVIEEDLLLAPNVMVAKLWKELTLSRILRLVDLPSLDGVLTHDAVDGRSIAFNVSSLARMVGGACASAAQSCLAAVASLPAVPPPPLPPPPLVPASHVTRRRSRSRSRHRSASPFGTSLLQHRNRQRSADGDFPQWIVLSMHCLAKWPESCSVEFVGDMPIYGGFELDVFQSLLDFLHAEPVPLIPSALHDLFMATLKLVRRNHAHSVEAMQLCYLLLPQRNRLRLHRLLRFVSKASGNSKLCLSEDRPNSLVLLEKLGPVILRRSARISSCQNDSTEAKDDLCTLVKFMVKHYQSILKVPDDLKEEVRERVAGLKEGKGSPAEVKHTYCRQVSTAQYEQQRQCNSHLQHHMAALLDAILADKTMTHKEKSTKLKMFQEQYPDVYAAKLSEKPHPLLQQTAATSSSGTPAKNRKPRIFHTMATRQGWKKMQ